MNSSFVKPRNSVVLPIAADVNKNIWMYAGVAESDFEDKKYIMPFGGIIDSGETCFKAAARELHEESLGVFSNLTPLEPPSNSTKLAISEHSLRNPSLTKHVFYVETSTQFFATKLHNTLAEVSDTLDPYIETYRQRRASPDLLECQEEVVDICRIDVLELLSEASSHRNLIGRHFFACRLNQHEGDKCYLPLRDVAAYSFCNEGVLNVIQQIATEIKSDLGEEIPKLLDSPRHVSPKDILLKAGIFVSTTDIKIPLDELKNTVFQNISNRNQLIHRDGAFVITDPMLLPKGGLTTRSAITKQALNLFFVADMGYACPQQLAVLRALQSKLLSERTKHEVALVGGGDWIYPRGPVNDSDKELERAYKTTMKEFASIGRQTPIYGAFGNHEYGDAFGPAEPEIFMDIANKLGVKIPGRYYCNTWIGQDYSLDLIVIDSTVLSCDSKQQQWIYDTVSNSTLLEHMQGKKIYRVLVSHHPYISNGCHGSDNTFLRIILKKILPDIDLILAGHEHDIQFINPEKYELPPTLICGTTSECREPGDEKSSQLSKSFPGFSKIEATKKGLDVSIYEVSWNNNDVRNSIANTFFSHNIPKKIKHNDMRILFFGNAESSDERDQIWKNIIYKSSTSALNLWNIDHIYKYSSSRNNGKRKNERFDKLLQNNLLERKAISGVSAIYFDLYGLQLKGTSRLKLTDDKASFVKEEGETRVKLLDHGLTKKIGSHIRCIDHSTGQIFRRLQYTQRVEKNRDFFLTWAGRPLTELDSKAILDQS